MMEILQKENEDLKNYVKMQMEKISNINFNTNDNKQTGFVNKTFTSQVFNKFISARTITFSFFLFTISPCTYNRK